MAPVPINIASATALIINAPRHISRRKIFGIIKVVWGNADWGTQNGLKSLRRFCHVQEDERISRGQFRRGVALRLTTNMQTDCPFLNLLWGAIFQMEILYIYICISALCCRAGSSMGHSSALRVTNGFEERVRAKLLLDRSGSTEDTKMSL